MWPSNRRPNFISYLVVFVFALLSAIVQLGVVIKLVPKTGVVATVATSVVLLLPLVVCIWSIISFRRRRSKLFLSYGIMFFVLSLIILVGFFSLLILALKSFT